MASSRQANTGAGAGTESAKTIGAGDPTAEPRDDRIASFDASYGIGLTEWLTTEARLA